MLLLFRDIHKKSTNSSKYVTTRSVLVYYVENRLN